MKLILKNTLALVMAAAAALVPLASVCVSTESAEPCISHTITYSNKGSRSEAQHGFLAIDGYDVPDNFTFLQYGLTGGRAFSFTTRSHLWGSDGYWPTEARIIPIGEGAFDDADLKQGWVQTPSQIPGIPQNWVYVEWLEGSAFVAPSSMEAMVEALNIPFIPRMAGMEELTREN